MLEPIEIFFWSTPNGIKITIACEEMGLPYKLTAVDISKGDQFKPDFLKISPNNRMPAIIDPVGPSGKPVSIFESGAILQYLGRKYGGGDLYGPTEDDRIAIDQWVHWQIGNLGPVSGHWNHFANWAPTLGADSEKLTYAVDRFRKELNRLHGVMESALKTRPWIANETFSIADIACWGWIRAHVVREDFVAEFPHVKAWFDRCAARPALQRGADAGKGLRTEQERLTTEELALRRKLLFGQTAKGVAEIASEKAQ